MKMRVVAMSMLACVVVGCSDPTASAQTDQATTTTPMLIGPGGSKMTATTGAVPPNLPSYVPGYPGATNLGGGVIAANSAQPGGLTKTLVNFTTTDSIDKVVGFYAAQLPANAVPVSVMPLSADMAMITGDATAVETTNGVVSAAISVAVTRDGPNTLIGISIDREIRPAP